jgi:flagellar basal body-associated protein FliL
MTFALIVLAIICVLLLALAGYVVWTFAAAFDRQGKQMTKMREDAFRREKYLITLILTSRPELAHALSVATEHEEPENEMTEMVPGFGAAAMMRGR